MRILFAVSSAITQSPAGPTSDIASTRYRVLVPAQQLARAGHQVQIASLKESGGSWPDSIKQAEVDALVISKSFHPANEELAAIMKARGTRVIADICDDYFDDAQYGTHFRNIIAAADQVVASSETMAESIRSHAGRESIVISDPIEGPRGVPAFAPKLPRLRITWFGLPFNLHGVVAKQDQLRELVERIPVTLRFVTSDWPDVRDFLGQLAKANPARLRVELVPWSVEATWKALAESDMVWIPVEEHAPRRREEPESVGRDALGRALRRRRRSALVPALRGPRAHRAGTREGRDGRARRSRARRAEHHRGAAARGEIEFTLCDRAAVGGGIRRDGRADAPPESRLRRQDPSRLRERGRGRGARGHEARRGLRSPRPRALRRRERRRDPLGARGRAFLALGSARHPARVGAGAEARRPHGDRVPESPERVRDFPEGPGANVRGRTRRGSAPCGSSTATRSGRIRS